MFDARFRAGLERMTGPVGKSMARAGLRADQLTACGLVAAGAAAVVIGRGWLRIGLAMLVLSALPDLLDGAVARGGGQASPRGEFFDSVADRVSDSLVLGGVAWYLAASGRPKLSVLALSVLALSMLVSYERAKGEALGCSARGGIMERGERIVALGVGLAFPTILVPVLWAMVALTGLTAVQRFVRVWRQAGSAGSTPTPEASVESRWQAWREQAQWRARAYSAVPDGARPAWGWRPRRADPSPGRRRARRTGPGNRAAARVERWRVRTGGDRPVRRNGWPSSSAGD
ncbi:MAG: CDP-alcohol phosphatidyltransferase family protein [Acidimicrobiales bacterium]